VPAIDSTPTHLLPFEHPTVLLFVRLYRRDDRGSGTLGFRVIVCVWCAYCEAAGVSTFRLAPPPHCSTVQYSERCRAA
jgi:hypothetical protein